VSTIDIDAVRFVEQRHVMEDPETWRWIWLAAAVALGVGEMATAGFFLLPFAIGALIAGVLAFMGVALAVQLVVFAGVSVGVFAALRPLAHKLDQGSEDHGIGAKRLVGAAAVVLEPIQGNDAGMVRIGTEEWRAESGDGQPIEAGTAVTVREVRGTRAVVVPAGSGTTSSAAPEIEEI
jgi:membrane protein implicated in regulation of membrane protease activity